MTTSLGIAATTAVIRALLQNAIPSAQLFGVRHPYVEAGLAKATVRRLATRLGLHGIAELPAAPA